MRRVGVGDDGDGVTVRPHPLRVRPLGSKLLSTDAIDLRDRLGALRVLPDELLLHVLARVGAQALGRCARVSRALRVLALSDDLWRTHYLEELPPTDRLRYDADGWWRTYVARALCATRPDAPDAPRRASLGGEGFYYYSDALYASWHCGTAAIPRRWSRLDNIERVDASSLSVADFVRRFEASAPASAAAPSAQIRNAGIATAPRPATPSTAHAGGGRARHPHRPPPPVARLHHVDGRVATSTLRSRSLPRRRAHDGPG